MTNCKVLILAAGRGRRMKSQTEDRPKGLIEVRGRPLIEWSLEALKQLGISQVGIVTGYKSEHFERFGFESCFHNSEWSNTNMVYSLLCARDWLGNEPVIIAYSDILFTSQSIEKLMLSPGEIVVANNTGWFENWSKRFSDPLIDAETFKRDDKGFLIEIGKKPKSLSEVQGQYMGLIKFTGSGWRAFESHALKWPLDTLRKIDMTSSLQSLIESGAKIATVDIHDEWHEFDSEDDLKTLL